MHGPGGKIPARPERCVQRARVSARVSSHAKLEVVIRHGRITTAADEGEGYVPQASPRGTYLQISEALRQKIEKGKIRDALPSEAELMRTYGVGRSTIGRALRTLKTDGVIESVQGAGWFVMGTGDRRPLVQKVTDILRREGAAVGDPFPSEKDLCNEFGASRTAVRSALALMEGRGLIEIGPSRRRRVRALPTEQEAS